MPRGSTALTASSAGCWCEPPPRAWSALAARMRTPAEGRWEMGERCQRKAFQGKASSRRRALHGEEEHGEEEECWSCVSAFSHLSRQLCCALCLKAQLHVGGHLPAGRKGREGRGHRQASAGGSRLWRSWRHELGKQRCCRSERKAHRGTARRSGAVQNSRVRAAGGRAAAAAAAVYSGAASTAS